MKTLLTRSALATALLISMTGANAASMIFETSDSDTIVVGATAEKVTLRVMGFKNLQPNASAPSGTKLGTFYMSTSTGVDNLAVTYGAEHYPGLNSGSSSSYLTGTITSGEGSEIQTVLTDSTGRASANVVAVNGTYWSLLRTPATTFEGGIYTKGAQKLSAGVYPITLRAALYQP